MTVGQEGNSLSQTYTLPACLGGFDDEQLHNLAMQDGGPACALAILYAIIDRAKACQSGMGEFGEKRIAILDICRRRLDDITHCFESIGLLND